MMAEVTQRAEQQQESQKTLVGTIISTPFQFLGVMFGSLVGAIIVSGFACISSGLTRAGSMPRPCSSTNSVGCRRGCYSVVVQEPGRTATWLAQLAYDWLFVKTGIVDWMTNMTTIAQAGPRSPLDVRYLTAQGLHAAELRPGRAVHGADICRAPGDPGHDDPVVPDGRVHRPGGRPGAPGPAQVRRRPGVQLPLPQGARQHHSASGRPLDALPGNPHQHQPLAHPAALRRAARRSGMHHSIHLQKYL